MFISLITLNTGIIPRESHKSGIKAYIEKTLESKKISPIEYKNLLASNPKAFADLINESTVNETYFFREEKQFALLKERHFPQWRALFGLSPIKIWSAACSYGEEAYSLALLAKECNINIQITASDINSEVLDHCKKGIFLASSIRQMDGLSFQHLFRPYETKDRLIDFPQEFKNLIQTRQINLSQIDSPQVEPFLPKNQNIVFLRNVFIYFNQELRARILKTISEKCLADDGLLFVSMSEIAQLDQAVMPPSLEKVMDGNVFYFHKTSASSKNEGKFFKEL